MSQRLAAAPHETAGRIIPVPRPDLRLKDPGDIGRGGANVGGISGRHASFVAVPPPPGQQLHHRPATPGRYD